MRRQLWGSETPVPTDARWQPVNGTCAAVVWNVWHSLGLFMCLQSLWLGASRAVCESAEGQQKGGSRGGASSGVSGRAESVVASEYKTGGAAQGRGGQANERSSRAGWPGLQQERGMASTAPMGRHLAPPWSLQLLLADCPTF